MGKSTLAREYAYQAQGQNAGVWWLNAGRVKDSKSWGGLEKGLVDLGSIFVRALDQAQDRATAARKTLEFIAYGGFAKPWLLVYDNVDVAAVLNQWAAVGNAHVLITTRLTAWGVDVAKIDVKEWAMPEAVSVAANPVEREKAIGVLNRLSLIAFVPETRIFSVHRLVQAAAGMCSETKHHDGRKAQSSPLMRHIPGFHFRWPSSDLAA